MLFKITNGAVCYGSQTILEEINFEIREKEKIAIVGRNGCGKTTLLNVIAGETEISEGTGEDKAGVSVSGGPSIGYIKQIAFEDDSLSLLEEIKKAYAPVIELEQRMREMLVILQTDHSEKNIRAYADMQERFEKSDGYSYKKEYESAIRKFGFTEEDKHKPLSEFSGGQRTKIAFIKLLLSKPDILLLDEPTNHLDIPAIEWLEEYIKNYRKAVVIVSHDRMFLDKNVDTVYEIEFGETTRYTGGYSSFAAQKRIKYEKQLRDFEAQRKEIARLTDIVNRFKYKPTKASMAFSKLKQIERMDKIDAPHQYDLKTFHANFQPLGESVKRVLKVSGLSVGYDKALSTVSFELDRGRKLGIIGPNGAGKSTFVKTIAGIIPGIKGKYEFGARVTVGYFDQQMVQCSSDRTVYDEFSDAFPELSSHEIRSALGAFLLSGDDVFKKVSMLSGGEKVRLALCGILKRRPNLLILDEPTNHLDIVGKETLENMLAEYKGTLIFISHDRYFVRKLADCLLVFDGDDAAFYPCGYERYTEECERLKKIAENAAAGEGNEEKKSAKSTYFSPLKEKSKKERRAKKLEELIAATENEIAGLNQQMDQPEVFSDYVKVGEVESKIAGLDETLMGYLTEWEELTTELSE